MPSIHPTGSGSEGQVPRKAFHSSVLGQETLFSKKLHKTGTTLRIIAETVEGLTSNIKANVSMYGYFLATSISSTRC